MYKINLELCFVDNQEKKKNSKNDDGGEFQRDLMMNDVYSPKMLTFFFTSFLT